MNSPPCTGQRPVCVPLPPGTTAARVETSRRGQPRQPVANSVGTTGVCAAGTYNVFKFLSLRKAPGWISLILLKRRSLRGEKAALRDLCAARPPVRR